MTAIEGRLSRSPLRAILLHGGRPLSRLAARNPTLRSRCSESAIAAAAEQRIASGSRIAAACTHPPLPCRAPSLVADRSFSTLQACPRSRLAVRTSGGCSARAPDLRDGFVLLGAVARSAANDAYGRSMSAAP